MIEQLTCVIVDDEPVARGIIRNYCSHLPFLQIIGEFGNALDARSFLSVTRADLLLLDIHMPVLSGIGFLKTLKNPPLVIFTTAYQEYAVNAFDLAACDYLLKPFSLERFIVAIDRVKEKMGSSVRLAGVYQKPDTRENAGSIFIKAEGKLQQVFFRDCLYAEAQGNYTRVVTTDTIILTKMAFSVFIRQFPSNNFIRVHRSFLVNKDHISQVEGNQVLLGRAKIPIAAPYKTDFLKAINAV